MNHGEGHIDRPTGAEAGRWALLAACLVPLLWVPTVFFPYIVPKGLFFQGAAGVATVAAVWAATGRAVRPDDVRDPILIGLLSFVALSAVSSLLGPSPHHSFFGGYERMWGGVQWLALLLFYVLLRTLFSGSHWQLFLRCTLYVAGGVALYAGSQLLVEGLASGTFDRNPFATLGNRGYLGAYMALATGLTLVMAGRTGRAWQRVALACAGAGFVSVAMLSGNRSSVLGLLAGAGGAVALLAAEDVRGAGGGRRWLYAALGLAVAGAAGSVLFFPEATARVSALGRLGEVTLSSESLLKRFEAWEAALEGARARPVLGWGSENFPLAYDRFVDPSSYRLGTVRFDRAHNVLLGKLVHAGAAGLLAYLAFWAGLVAVTVRGWWTRRLGPLEAAGFLLAFTAYFVFLQMWFEDHSSAAVLVALAAYLRHRYTGGRPLLRLGERRERSGARRAVWMTVCLALLAGVAWTLGKSGLAAHRLYQGTAARPLGESVRRYEDARRLGAAQHRTVAMEYGTAMARIGVEAGPYLRRSDSLRSVYRRGVGGAEQALNRAGARNPMSGRLDAVRGRLATGAGSVYSGEQIRRLATSSMRRAIEKSPPLLAYRHFLAEIQNMFGDRTAARRTLHQALEVYDGFGRTYYLLARVNEDLTDPASLRRLRQAFWLGYRPPDWRSLRQVVVELTERGRPEEAERLLSAYFASHYLPALRTVDDPFARERRAFFASLDADVAPPGRRYRSYDIRPGDLALLAMWPRAAMEAGQCRRARLAMGLLLNGLSAGAGTADLRPIMARQMADLRGRCARTAVSRR